MLLFNLTVSKSVPLNLCFQWWKTCNHIIENYHEPNAHRREQSDLGRDQCTSGNSTLQDAHHETTLSHTIEL